MKKNIHFFNALLSSVKCVVTFLSVCMIGFTSCSEDNEGLDDVDENCVIYYVTNDNQVLILHSSPTYGTNLVSNTYHNGHGMLIFDAPVTSIGEKAFIYNANLISMYLPEKVTKIGVKAFTDCSNLEYVSMENKVTTIEAGAFHGCHKLEDIHISDEVTHIGERAFASCRNLYNMHLGNKVVSIGDLAFEGCKNLSLFSCQSETPPLCGKNIFYGCESLQEILVPKGSIAAYKSAEGWKQYADKIVGY